jgi:hypothetical protein
MRALRYGFGMASILVLASLLAVVFGHVRVNILPKVLAHENAPKAADEEALCPRGNATLRGTYMSRAEGTAVGIGPIAAVGWLTYDGKGHVVNGFTFSGNGVISRGTISGPYTVNSDCTGSTELSGNHYDQIVTPDGSRVDWIATDPGLVFSGTEVRLKPTHAEDGN